MRVLHLANRQANARFNWMAYTSWMAYTATPQDFEKIARGENKDVHYVEAADVDAVDPSTAYCMTNSVRTYWHAGHNPHVTPTGKSLRSTSAGDLLIYDGKVMLIAMVGFKRLDMNPEDVACEQAPQTA